MTTTEDKRCRRQKLRATLLECVAEFVDVTKKKILKCSIILKCKLFFEIIIVRPTISFIQFF